MKTGSLAKQGTVSAFMEREEEKERKMLFSMKTAVAADPLFQKVPLVSYWISAVPDAHWVQT